MPACNNNECYCTLYGDPITIVQDLCRATVPDPARDYWWVATQATTLDISSDTPCISRGSISSVQGQFFSLKVVL